MAKKILLIDDDRNSVKYLAAVLKNHGYESASAHDGRAGLEKIESFAPDLIVLDVMMPEKSGLLLCGELKRDERYRHIPILMLTGVSAVLEELERPAGEPASESHDTFVVALQKKVRDLREAGLITPDLFLDKPVEPDDFIAKVQQLTGS